MVSSIKLPGSKFQKANTIYISLSSSFSKFSPVALAPARTQPRNGAPFAPGRTGRPRCRSGIVALGFPGGVGGEVKEDYFLPGGGQKPV